MKNNQLYCVDKDIENFYHHLLGFISEDFDLKVNLVLSDDKTLCFWDVLLMCQPQCDIVLWPIYVPYVYNDRISHY